ncbi:MAG: hypothetical protein D6701_15165, partial [Gemmatimonadetes bacterium]
MARPLFLILHGSGIYTHDWAAEHLARLKAVAATYPGIAQGGDLGDQVSLVTVRYDQVFENLLERWEQQGDKLQAFLDESSIRLPRLAAFLRDRTTPPDERGFLWTHVLDPVVYRGIPLVRDEVRAVVLQQVVAAINDHLQNEPGADVSIMGHSLGTIVLHDVLELMGTGASSDAGDVWRSDRFRFANVFQVANASRLGPPGLIDLKPYDSVVRPLSAGPGGSGAPYCSAFYTIRNVWDPVTWWQRFKPTGWGAGFQEVVVRHLHQLNVHGFIHYLEHPDVHVRIFRALLGNWVVPGPLWQQRVAEFPDLAPGSCGATVAALQNELD